jgi:hypothetical protein
MPIPGSTWMPILGSTWMPIPGSTWMPIPGSTWMPILGLALMVTEDTNTMAGWTMMTTNKKRCVAPACK